MSAYTVTEDQQYLMGGRGGGSIKTAAQAVRDLRVAEVVKQDIQLEGGGVITYRTKLQLSFMYEQER